MNPASVLVGTGLALLLALAAYSAPEIAQIMITGEISRLNAK